MCSWWLTVDVLQGLLRSLPYGGWRRGSRVLHRNVALLLLPFWLLAAEARRAWWMLAGCESRWSLPTASQQEERPTRAPDLGKHSDSSGWTRPHSGRKRSSACVWGKESTRQGGTLSCHPRKMVYNSFPSIIWGFSEASFPTSMTLPAPPHPPAWEDHLDSTVKLFKVWGITPLRVGHPQRTGLRGTFWWHCF